MDETSTSARATITFGATIMPVTDMDRSVAHYTALGFQVEAANPTYAKAIRDNFFLHLSLNKDHDPKVGAACIYADVDDPDALAAEWSAAGTGGRIDPPVDRSWGVREGAHFDPDNNLIRFGTRR